MHRRQFLSSTVLSGLALAGVAGKAQAFTEQKCDDLPGTLTCKELIRHHELLAQLESQLAAKGLDDKQRQAILASAVCPFCGQPLMG